MVQLNFASTFTSRFSGTITKSPTDSPDYYFDGLQILDSLVVDIKSATPNTVRGRAAAYVCPALRTTNPTGYLLLQSHVGLAFPGQRLVFTRADLVLGSLDSSGGVNRKDLVIAVWVLQPFASINLEFFTG